jgi:8-oxo-dGTP diphosphatase
MNGKLRNLASIFIMKKDEMLMLYRIGSPVVDPSWCSIGGHFEKDELNDARACVLRELEEEMRIQESDLTDIELRYVTLRLNKNEIRQNYYFFAGLKEGTEVVLECDEGIPRWFPLDALGALDMPFTTRYVVDHFLKIGRYTELLYGGIATENGISFTELREFTG